MTDTSAADESALATELADLKQAVGDVAVALKAEIDSLRTQVAQDVIDRLQGMVDELSRRAGVTPTA